MMKPKRFTLSPQTIDDDGISVLQTTVGAANFTITGAQASGGAVSYSYAYRLDLTSGGNISGVNFTITGTTANNVAQTEVIAGPNNNTVTTVSYFKTISQIAVDGAVGTNTKVGSTDELVTNAIPLDIYDEGGSVAADVTGTINYTIQQAHERPTAGETPNWGSVTALTSQTADARSLLAGPMGAVRVVVNSYSNTATLSVNLTQGGSASVLESGDVELGAVEIKDGTTDARAKVVAASTLPAATDTALVVSLRDVMGVVLTPSANVLTAQRPSVTQVVSTALAASQIMKASAGQLVQLTVFSGKATAQFILVLNSATLTGDGAVTLLLPPIPIGAGQIVQLDFPAPVVASAGITVCNSSTGSFTKTIGAADCVFYGQVN